MDAQTIFGNNVRQARVASGMSQEELAFQAGLARSYMSDVERGRRNPTVKIVGQIAAALKVSASVLVEGIPEDIAE
ncbi:helix-turn-helix domain-containing protein [Sphingomonas colocasiae]|uniref:Helix-turn-helix domain-containing protein n=1 Tax=Sphingomonas colocasiae TaxID=1848973 RepID=A0ABS7PJY9_9SPHN|nr:helix-turn-helix transcriptional regulator [Sphingomonas colocasiae]MBY8821055.1 helix-turn-helix domain-containing protein [Sphingomonas colocasiae]